MRTLSTIVLTASLAAVCLGQNAGPAHGSGQGVQALVQDAKTRVTEMKVDQLKSAQASGEKLTLIDVREDNEWEAGHAAGAMHLSRGLIEFSIESKVPEKNTKIVLYCGSGARSALAADSIMKMGYTNVVSLAGGMGAYKAAGLPTEK
ncbi:MAG: sulfurtransferase [Acidobacteriia bacterium]|nr:sulfurtransferase [Terriglobia bacterium]